LRKESTFFLKDEIERWEKVIRAANVTLG